MDTGQGLPRGTVTMLFTDIEGSTRLLKRLGNRYGELLADHRRLLHEAFEAHDGRELGTAGDSFLVAFRRARDAVEAATDAQRLLAAHRWPEDLPCRVRMGLHTGEPSLNDDGYHGIVLHRGARIADAGHGGQVLLSSATAELVQDDLPAGVALRSLGEHQLKDIDRPERLYQLVVDGLPSEFPPPRTLISKATSLMQARVLGPLELIGDDGLPVALPAGKPRALLALLLLEAGRVISVERLVDGLWGARPPTTAGKVLQGYVSRLRKLLPPGTLETREPGYMLRLDEDRLDLNRFERLRREAAAATAAGRAQAAAELLTEALELWRGPPLANVGDDLDLSEELARLEELRLATLEERIAADLQLGREAQVVAELESLTQAHPLRERLRFQLMLALYGLGRQAEALAVYRDTRELLVDELGIEPGAELQRLERLILTQDETLVPVSRTDRLPPVPAALTPLIDRLTERTEIGALLRRPGKRLVTLVGPGGVGKTRLALAFAEPRPDAAFISLAPVHEPALVRSVIAHALGVRDETALAEALSRRELLLVLDNFEHLLEVAPLVTELLSAAPGLRVLATSRAPLNVTGEHQYTVAPLRERDAVELFVERAAAVDVGVEPATAVEDICRRLDCLPLAIELAAARTKTLPPDVLLSRLEQRLPLLTHGPRDRPERQRTLRATIEWSYALLEPPEQDAFARLAVFAGGCSLEAAEEVCNASLETLDSLADKSLVQRTGDRFTMLETVREYAREHLAASGETDWTTRRLVDRLCRMAEEFAGERRRGLASSLAPLESELENIRVTMRAVLGWVGDPLALQLATALAWFWRVSGRQAEGLRWTVEALEQAAEAPDAARAEALHEAALLATLAADPERGRAFGHEALALHRAGGEDQRVGEILPWLAHAHLQSGDVTGARALYSESVAMQERFGSPFWAARAYRLAAEGELELGDPGRAKDSFERALELGHTAGATGEVVMTLHGLGDLALVSGDAVAAASFYLQALDASVEPTPAANCLAGLAAAAALEQLVEPAGRLWGAVKSYQRRHGEQFIYAPTARRYEAVFARLDEASFQAAVEGGGELTLDEATREAHQTFGGS